MGHAERVAAHATRLMETCPWMAGDEARARGESIEAWANQSIEQKRRSCAAAGCECCTRELIELGEL